MNINITLTIVTIFLSSVTTIISAISLFVSVKSLKLFIKNTYKYNYLPTKKDELINKSFDNLYSIFDLYSLMNPYYFKKFDEIQNDFQNQSIWTYCFPNFSFSIFSNSKFNVFSLAESRS